MTGVIKKVNRPGTFKKGNQFAKGHRGSGGKKLMTKNIVEAALAAAEAVGRDGNGKDGMVGYLTSVAKRHPKQFITFLGRCIPVQVHGTGFGENGVTVNMVNRIEIVAAVNEGRYTIEETAPKAIELKRA